MRYKELGEYGIAFDVEKLTWELDFFLKHFVKDMKLALTEANMSNLNLDVLSQVLANYELLQAEGYGDLGTQALIKYYEEEMNA